MTNIHGIKVYRGASFNISFIVDDSFMFCWANEEEIESLYAIFDQLEHTSDQHKQPSKVQIFFFSKNTFQSTCKFISNFLGVSKCLGIHKYFCLPSMVGRKKKTIFK